MSANVELFFDGACPVCRREANHYRKQMDSDSLTLTDIAAAGFDAAAHGLDAKRVQQTIHARLPDGKVVTGIDAFAAVWSKLPRYRWLVPVTRTPGVRQLMQLGYAGFAAVRPHLPGRTKACTVG